MSSATVFPGSTEEVVKVVKWANEFEIPIYPISMGRNCGLSLSSELFVHADLDSSGLWWSSSSSQRLCHR